MNQRYMCIAVLVRKASMRRMLNFLILKKIYKVGIYLHFDVSFVILLINLFEEDKINIWNIRDKPPCQE